MGGKGKKREQSAAVKSDPFRELIRDRVRMHLSLLFLVADAARRLLPKVGERACDVDSGQAMFHPLPHPSLSEATRDEIRPHLETDWWYLDVMLAALDAYEEAESAGKEGAD